MIMLNKIRRLISRTLWGILFILFYIHPLHAQQLMLPNIDFVQFEEEALKAVQKLPRKGGFNKSETYNHLYIFAAQMRDSMMWDNIKTQTDFIRNIDFQKPVQFDGYNTPTNIYADYIYDSEGNMRWIYADGKATKVDLSQTGNSPQNFLVEVAKLQYQMVFVLKEALPQKAFFGIKNGVAYISYHLMWEAYDTYTIKQCIELNTLKPIITNTFDKTKRLDHIQEQLQGYNKTVKVDSISTMPTFMGGDLNKFRVWFQKQFNNHSKHITRNTNILLKFTIGTDGWVETVEIIQADDINLAQIAAQIVKESPQWTPGMHDGEPVRVYYQLPISIKVENRTTYSPPNNFHPTH